MVIVLVPN